MATLNIEIPDAKANQLVEFYAKKYNLEVPTTLAKKKAFLEKAIVHEHIVLMRTVIAKQKEQEALQAIQADPDIAQSSLEAEQQAKNDLINAKLQQDMQNIAPQE
jgi:hypothetical protein